MKQVRFSLRLENGKGCLDAIATAIIMPDDVAEEKEKALLALGAHVEKVRPASIVDKKQVRFACFISFTSELELIAT